MDYRKRVISKGGNPQIYRHADLAPLLENEDKTPASGEEIIRKNVYTTVKLSDCPQSTRLIE